MNNRVDKICDMADSYVSFMKGFIRFLTVIVILAAILCIGTLLLTFSASSRSLILFFVLALLCGAGAAVIIAFFKAVFLNGLGSVVLYCAHKAELSVCDSYDDYEEAAAEECTEE